MPAIASRTSGVALPICGVSTTLDNFCERLVDFRLVFEHVEAGAGDLFLRQRCTSAASSTIGSARCIDEERGLLHQPQLARADLMPGLLIERRMDRDEIGLAQQLLERHVNEAGLALFALRLAPRRPVEDAHAKTAGAARHRLADQAAAADQGRAFCPRRRSPAERPTGCRERRRSAPTGRLPACAAPLRASVQRSGPRSPLW